MGLFSFSYCTEDTLSSCAFILKFITLTQILALQGEIYSFNISFQFRLSSMAKKVLKEEDKLVIWSFLL